MVDQANYVPLCGSLRDRFGDHGLISIVVLRRGAEQLEISDWLMSCRVLTRGVEQFLMNRVVEIARKYGYSSITGEYVPTPKNAMVKNFFQQFGFEKVAGNGGRTQWRLDPARYQAPTVHIREID